MMAYFVPLVPVLLRKNPQGLTYEEIEDILKKDWRQRQVDTYPRFRDEHLRLYLGVFDGEPNPDHTSSVNFNAGMIQFKDGKFFLKPGNEADMCLDDYVFQS